jgi:hypothetical protein
MLERQAMRPFFIVFALFISSAAFSVDALAQPALQARVARIAADALGTVSISCLLPGTVLNCGLHPHNHSQSVFKFPLVLTVLHLADTGKLLPTH